MVRYIMDMDKLPDKCVACHNLRVSQVGFLLLCCSFQKVLHVQKYWIFKLSRVSLNNAFLTILATWIKDPVHEYFLYEHILNN